MTRSTRGYEVRFCWRGSVLSSELFGARETIWVGDRPDARFVLPSEALEQPFALLAPDDRGHARVAGPDGASIQTVGKTTVATIGDLTFVVSETELPARVAQHHDVDWRAWRYIALSFLLHGVVIGLFQLTPPSAMALSRDVNGDRARYIRYRLDAAERDAPAQAWLEARSAGPGATDAHRREPASATPANRTPGRGGTRTAGRHDVTASTRQLGAAAVRGLGTLRTLASLVPAMAGDAGPYAGAGLDRDAMGEDGPGTSLFPGLDLGSPGGSCAGAACLGSTIAVGPLDTRPGGVPGSTDAMGAHMGPRKPGANGGPILRPGVTETRGGLTSEQVRRVIHQNLGQVRFCYERALPGRPDLAGRVAARFIISPSGTVQAAVVSQSDLGAPDVDACITAALRRLTFPPSPGLTIVTYPFVLQHAR